MAKRKIKQTALHFDTIGCGVRMMNNFESEIAENEKRHKKKYKENAELRRDWVQTLLVRGNTNGK